MGRVVADGLSIADSDQVFYWSQMPNIIFEYVQNRQDFYLGTDY